IRTRAFREIGGYEPRLFMGAEESLFALEAARRDWQGVYADELVTPHHPSHARSRKGRGVLLQPNQIRIAWLRLAPALGWHRTREILRRSRRHGTLLRVIAALIRSLPWIARNRDVVSAKVSGQWSRVAQQPAGRKRAPLVSVHPSAANAHANPADRVRART